jgi:hypothetical protein
VVDGVLAFVTACSLLLAFALFFLWRHALRDARYWKDDAGYWFDAWTKASKHRPEAADWWKGGGGG